MRARQQIITKFEYHKYSQSDLFVEKTMNVLFRFIKKYIVHSKLFLADSASCHTDTYDFKAEMVRKHKLSCLLIFNRRLPAASFLLIKSFHAEQISSHALWQEWQTYVLSNASELPTWENDLQGILNPVYYFFALQETFKTLYQNVC